MSTDRTIDASLKQNPVVLGLWPMAGITSGGATWDSSLSTLKRAKEIGITTFDTAYSYGYEGECDRLLAAAFADCRDQVTLIGKVGQRWTADRQRVVDCRPETLQRDARESVARTAAGHFDLLMLHAIDPKVPIGESAAAMADLQREGLAKQIGVCNVDLQQLQEFTRVIRPAAVQVSLNILQREMLEQLIPWCHQQQIGVHVYWVLMKGILAGKITRDYQFPAGDSRPRYPIYQGAYRERVHRLVDRLRTLAVREGKNVAELSIGWALAQPGVTGVLIGAKRPEQIEETANATALAPDLLSEVEIAVENTVAEKA